ncbi:hypothetical protein F5X99DRAFT_430685 [Biscogniauxia marginata]|nr:hypothetical protein F5X99DRAFT_430685 [Biscogniauxia marginata]
MPNSPDLPISAKEPWQPKPGFYEIAEAIGLQLHHLHSRDALTELVYVRGIQATIVGDITAFLRTYPWKRDFSSARGVVDKALERHATNEGVLNEVVHESHSLEDHLVAFANNLRDQASQMEAENASAAEWFPKSSRQVLAFSLALMLWLYLEHTSLEAITYDPSLKPYIHALTYLRLCFRCTECNGGCETSTMSEGLPRGCHLFLVQDPSELVQSPTSM